MSLNRKLALALIASSLSAAVTPAVADTAELKESLQPATANIVQIGGGASALTYWVDGADGRHVVTTIDVVARDGTGHGEDRHSILRFSSVLKDGQSQTISVPGIGRTKPAELMLRNTGGHIEAVHAAAAKQGTVALD